MESPNHAACPVCGRERREGTAYCPDCGFDFARSETLFPDGILTDESGFCAACAPTGCTTCDGCVCDCCTTNPTPGPVRREKAEPEPIPPPPPKAKEPAQPPPNKSIDTKPLPCQRPKATHHKKIKEVDEISASTVVRAKPKPRSNPICRCIGGAYRCLVQTVSMALIAAFLASYVFLLLFWINHH
jgi:hypothetical protein